MIKMVINSITKNKLCNKILRKNLKNTLYNHYNYFYLVCMVINTIKGFKVEMVAVALFWPSWTLAWTLIMTEWRLPGTRVTPMSIALVTRAVWTSRLWNLPVGVSITRTIFLSSVLSLTSCLLSFYFFHYFFSCLNVHYR